MRWSEIKMLAWKAEVHQEEGKGRQPRTELACSGREVGKMGEVSFLKPSGQSKDYYMLLYQKIEEQLKQLSNKVNSVLQQYYYADMFRGIGSEVEKMGYNNRSEAEKGREIRQIYKKMHDNLTANAHRKLRSVRVCSSSFKLPN